MLECRHLDFSYNGKEKVLSDITLSFEKGLFYGIYGANGSGKSTLLQLLTGELKSSSGVVSPCWRSPRERAQYIALVEQQIPPSLPLTVAEVAALGHYPGGGIPQGISEKVREVLALLELEKFSERSFNRLSGGEKQRVMLARALVQDTPVLCLDEPGSSLDIGFQHTLCRLLKKLAREGKCVIMISHDLFSAPAYLDRMIFLEKGRVLWEGEGGKLQDASLLKRLFRLPVSAL